VARRFGRVRRRAANTATEIILGARRLTASARGLPDFIVVGAQKAGTTSFYWYLSQLPAVEPSFRKEVHYFDLNYGHGEAWYRAFFPTRAKLHRNAAITGEATPYYLFHPAVPQRIHDLVPSAKIIILLRDPAQRALSHFEHEHRLGNETFTLSEALAAEQHRLGDIEARLEETAAVSWAHQHSSYRARGLYLPQVRRYFERFGRERCHVILSEELFDDPVATVRQAAEFLDIDSATVSGLDLAPRGVNKARAPRDHAHREALAELRMFFAPANQVLAEYLGRELPWPRS
jgi:hypothetical protein